MAAFHYLHKVKHLLAVEALNAEDVYDEQLGRGELVEAFVDGGCEPGEGYVLEEFLGAEVPDLVAEHACLSLYGGAEPALAPAYSVLD